MGAVLLHGASEDGRENNGFRIDGYQKKLAFSSLWMVESPLPTPLQLC